MVLDEAKHLKRVEALTEPATEAVGDRGDDVALAPVEQLKLVVAVEQVALVIRSRERVGDHLHDLAREQPLDDGLDRLAGDERHHLGRVQAAEVVRIVGQERPRREHDQDRVVTLEGREDVGVGLQRRQPVR